MTVLAALLITLVASTAHASTACSVVYTISPQNSSAFGATITINNTGTTALSGWSLTWTFANGQTIASSWNGAVSQSGANVTVSEQAGQTWENIPAGGSYTGFGFNGTWNGTTNSVPTNFAINGVACNGSATSPGSFKLAPSASSLSIAQGASGTDTITVTDVSSFSGAVTLTNSGLPSGVSASFTPNPTIGSSLLTFTASGSAAAGTSTVTITGTNSSASPTTATATVALTVTSPTSCSATNPIVPYISVAGVWSAAGESTVTVASGTVVDLGPWPVSGGSWVWTGPNGFTSTSREIDDIALTTGINTYTATYTINGCSYKQTFTVTVTVTATGQAPCDILASDGHACVAAYSTTRALFADYQGHLYQVHRTSDSTYLDITPSSAGGHANAAAQNTFCANTTCTITKLYDQTTDGNDLSVAGPGANVPTADSPVTATALPVTVGGNQVYGMYFNSGNGYRNDSTRDIPVNADPEGAYMVTSGTHFNQYCCFDFGNAEVDNGYASNYAPSHMDAINFGSDCWFDSCYGSGPWVQVDLECCGKLGTTTNSDDTGLTMPFVTAYLRNEGVGNYYLDGGDATKANGNLSFYAGPLPSGYSPMHQEGAILLGIGGDNSDWGVGSFFEGAITAGVYSNNALDSIQANVAAAQYASAK
jgi:hypothetical protein